MRTVYVLQQSYFVHTRGLRTYRFDLDTVYTRRVSDLGFELLT